MVRRALELLAEKGVRPALVTLLLSLPVTLFDTRYGLTSHGGLAEFGLLMVVAVPLGALQSSLVLVAFLHQDERSSPLTVSRWIESALRAWIPVLGVQLAVMLVAGLGTVLLIVPGVIALLAFFVADAIVVAERTSPLDAMERSARLTKGHRGVLLGAALILALPPSILNAAIGYIGPLDFASDMSLGLLSSLLWLPATALIASAYSALASADQLASELEASFDAPAA